MIQQARLPQYSPLIWTTLGLECRQSSGEPLEVHRSKNGLKLTAGAQVAPLLC